jgi:hypothetical protein
MSINYESPYYKIFSSLLSLHPVLIVENCVLSRNMLRLKRTGWGPTMHLDVVSFYLHLLVQILLAHMNVKLPSWHSQKFMRSVHQFSQTVIKMWRYLQHRLGFAVLTVLNVKSTVFWVITRSSSETDRRFREKYRLHLQNRRVSQARNQQKQTEN